MAEVKRKHFGVLCSTIDIANQYDIWQGIVEVAGEHDINLTAYIGTYQTTDNNFYSYLESCYTTMFGSNSNLDGVIMLSGFLAQNVGLSEFNYYAEKIPKGIPVVSVSFDLKGIPSVITHNRKGMYSAVNHLIRVHKKRNIAFIKGPDGHPEAEARLCGYKDALADNNIPFRGEYLFDGDFGRDSGRAAVTELYEVRKLPADAFACCNDQSAIGVLQFLKNRGIMVPGDVAVTGFDNDIISSLYVPSIGTVGQDFTELGRISARMLLDLVAGKPAENVIHYEPEYIPRQSCGCLSKDNMSSDYAARDSEDTGCFRDYAGDVFFGLFKDKVSGELIIKWADILVNLISEKPFERDGFLTGLDKMLVTYYHSYSTEFSVWHKALIMLAMGIEQHSHEFENTAVILSTLTYATTFVFDIRMSEERKKEYTLNDDRMRRRRNTNKLLLMFDVDGLAEELCKAVSGLQLQTALIGIFKNPVKRGDEKADRTIETLIGFDGDDRINQQHSAAMPISFSDYSSIRGFDYNRERRTFFFQPLFFLEEEVGVMLLPYDPDVPTDTYETLRINISTTLKGAQLMSTIHTLSVTDELTGLYNRRGFFQFTYSRLHHLYRSGETIPLVMFMDMDGLKSINDNYGHSEGDAAIKAFAEILRQTMREEDIIGRIGGDEFAALSSVRSRENAAQLEDRLRRAYDEYNGKGLRPYKISGSIGCVVLDVATKECFEEAMLSADTVLYEEKQRKRKLGLIR